MTCEYVGFLFVHWLALSLVVYVSQMPFAFGECNIDMFVHLLLNLYGTTSFPPQSAQSYACV